MEAKLKVHRFLPGIEEKFIKGEGKITHVVLIPIPTTIASDSHK